MCLSLSLYRRFLDQNTYHIGLSNRAMLDYSVSLIPCLFTQVIILTSKNQPVNRVHTDANVNILPLMFSIRQWKQLSYAVIHRWSAFTQTASCETSIYACFVSLYNILIDCTDDNYTLNVYYFPIWTWGQYEMKYAIFIAIINQNSVLTI